GSGRRLQAVEILVGARPGRDPAGAVPALDQEAVVEVPFHRLLVGDEDHPVEPAREVAQVLGHGVNAVSVERTEALVDNHRSLAPGRAADILADAECQGDRHPETLAPAEVCSVDWLANSCTV